MNLYKVHNEKENEKMFGKLRNVSVNGYRPFNGLNIFLSVVCILACLVIYGGMGYAWEMSSTIALLVAIGCFALILYRNRKIESIPKMIGFTVLSVVFSFFAIIALFFSAIGAGMSIMNGGSSGNFGGTVSNIFGSTGGSKNNNGQDTGFSKQDDLNAQMQGYANAQQYQDLTGYSGRDINPDDDYTRA